MSLEVGDYVKVIYPGAQETGQIQRITKKRQDGSNYTELLVGNRAEFEIEGTWQDNSLEKLNLPADLTPEEELIWIRMAHGP